MHRHLANRLPLGGRLAYCPPAATASARLFSTPSATATSPSPFQLERLHGRTLIRVRGAQSAEFLQSLITNDIQHLQPDASVAGADSATKQQAIYTLFLNKQGRVLYDSIIYKPNAADETYFLECDRHIDADLQKHLKIFRVRKKIDIDVVGKELALWVAFNPAAAHDELAQRTLPGAANGGHLVTAVADPRLQHLGTRLIAPVGLAAADLLTSGGVAEAIADAHRLHRYRLGIGEGSDELPVAKCFPLESNADYLHGVSFHKGCYLGQEFTARTHHTGVVRKRLLPVQFADGGGRLTPNSSRNVESTDGAVLGKVRGFAEDCGLALLKYEPALREEAALVFGGNGDGVLGRPRRPVWWPQEAPAVRKAA